MAYLVPVTADLVFKKRLIKLPNAILIELKANFSGPDTAIMPRKPLIILARKGLSCKKVANFSKVS